MQRRTASYRFRAGPVSGNGEHRHAHAGSDGHAQLHGARTSCWEIAQLQRHRCLRTWRSSLPTADRPSTFCRRNDLRNRPAGFGNRAATTAPAKSENRSRPCDYLPEVSRRKSSAATLPLWRWPKISSGCCNTSRFERGTWSVFTRRKVGAKKSNRRRHLSRSSRLPLSVFCGNRPVSNRNARSCGAPIFPRERARLEAEQTNHPAAYDAYLRGRAFQPVRLAVWMAGFGYFKRP